MPYFVQLIESLYIGAKYYCEKSLIEIICVNDGSTDESFKFVNNYESYKNFRIISIQNSGVSNARNVGLNCCKGEYVWFVDADDYIPDNGIAVIIEKLQSIETCVDIIFANFFAYEEKNNEKSIFFNSNYDFNYFDKVEEHDDIFDIIFNKTKVGFTLWNQIFNINFLQKNMLNFNTDIHISEDFMFKVASIYNASSIDYINDEIYGYRLPNGRGTLSQKLPTALELDSLINEEVKWFYIFDKKYNYESGAKYMKLLFSESLNMWFKYLSMYRADQDAEYINSKRKEIVDILEYLPDGVSAIFHKNI